jgi:predicted PhzF superfamily epimerase YddE/YHI9
MKRIPCFQIDAFTERPFGGNPAAVCWLEQPVDPAWMQQVAQEMNLSETAFVAPGKRHLNLRWFTPVVEVDLCGHATLATAHALWSEGLVPSDRPLVFETHSGELTCRLVEGWIELNFPATPPTPCEPPDGLFDSLGVAGDWVGRSRFDLLVHYPDPRILRGLTPDFVRMKSIAARGVIVTAPSDLPGVDLLSRFFAPQVGVDEDPVCGSAHCCLAPFWASRLGQLELVARQVSRREGHLRLRVAGDRVVLGGHARTVWRGELLV